jgi:hypothetical protein
MNASDYLIRKAQADAINLTGNVSYRGFTIQSWHIDGYGWVGEVRDSGNNLMPDWMNSRIGQQMRFHVVGAMMKSIDEYLSKVQS